MKIAMLGQSYPPMISGASLFICHLAEALAERGNKVLVLAASDQGESYYQKSDNLTVLRLQSFPNPMRVNQRFLIWPENEILSALREFAPDIIHVHEPFQLAYFARLYSQQADVPCILTIHGLPSMVSTYIPENSDLHQFIEKGLWKYASWLIRQFDAKVTPTETISRLVAEQTGEHPYTISGGVDLRTFTPDPLNVNDEVDLRASLGVPADGRIILHVGRLDEGKNIIDIVRAAALIMNENPRKNIHLVMIGDGCERPLAEKLAHELDVAEYCHFPGYIHDVDQISAIYRISDLFCMASEIETQGLVLLEAAACGLPIVAYDSTAVHEIVQHGVNGFLVQSRDVGRLAEGMKTILKDPELMKRMKKAGWEAVQVHDFDRTVDEYEALYRSLVQVKIEIFENTLAAY